MEHAEALELIELAAVEPDGLERLMAGDTPESGAVAGHLAGCPACVAELARIRRTAAVARRVIAAAPDPELKARTLAFVREVGRDRSGAGEPAAESQPPAATASPAPVIQPPPAAAPPAVSPPLAPARPGWLRWGALAAAVVLAAGLGFGAATLRSQESQLAYEVSVLETTAATTLRLDAMPDTQRFALAATDAGGGATGSLAFSPSSGELVMVAEGLAPLAEGQEYGCWVEVDGVRTRIGRMYPGGELQAWAGPVEGLAALPEDAVFGVSLVPASGGAGEPVLTGGG